MPLLLLRLKDRDKEYWQSASLAVSTVGVLTLHQLGRRGMVPNLLSQYGRVLKTHRVFRQYIWLAVGPYLLSSLFLHYKYAPHVEALWTIHSNRLNKQLLDDPEGTMYPQGKQQWTNPL